MSNSHWPRLLLFDLAHTQCNGIIKGWLHCLTPETIGRFLVNNILFGSARCLIMALIRFSLIKKQRLDVQNTSLTPTPTSDNISFLLYPHPRPLPPSPPSPSKWTSYVYHPLAKRTFSTTKMVTCCLKSCSNQLKLHKNVSCHKMLDRDVLRTLSNI